MVPGIVRAVIVVAAAAVVLIGAGVAAQDQTQTGGQGPPPPPPSDQPQPPIPPPPLPPPDAGQPSAGAAPAAGDETAADTDAEAEKPKPRPAEPAGPPMPVRAPTAILRVLDKVTAETMAFEAPVGRRVRYKSLVFEVKACETRGAGDAQPQPSAYLLVTSDAGSSIGAIGGAREVFRGWMFANAPSLHALQHPVYDAWLVSCSTVTPSA